ncbi:conserved hypothetical protein [Vibrio chagasii]|nr:conserved hypothetical protein [Vibrio chagasii]
MFNPNTALNHLTQSNNGSNRLAAMIGAKNFAFSGEQEYVSFRFPRSNGVNYCKISLVNDEYNMELGSIHGINYKVKHTFEGLPTENLKRTFEQNVKQDLSL